MAQNLAVCLPHDPTLARAFADLRLLKGTRIIKIGQHSSSDEEPELIAWVIDDVESQEHTPELLAYLKKHSSAPIASFTTLTRRTGASSYVNPELLEIIKERNAIVTRSGRPTDALHHHPELDPRQKDLWVTADGFINLPNIGIEQSLVLVARYLNKNRPVEFFKPRDAEVQKQEAIWSLEHAAQSALRLTMRPDPIYLDPGTEMAPTVGEATIDFLDYAAKRLREYAEKLHDKKNKQRALEKKAANIIRLLEGRADRHQRDIFEKKISTARRHRVTSLEIVSAFIRPLYKVTFENDDIRIESDLERLLWEHGVHEFSEDDVKEGFRQWAAFEAELSDDFDEIHD